MLNIMTFPHGTTCVKIVSSPVGDIAILANDLGITRLDFQEGKQPIAIQDHWHEGHKHLTKAAKQLTQYFSGTRQEFSLPLVLKGTPFQEQVWAALQHLRFGQRCSYSDIATEIHNPKAVRAVGAANGKNPIALIVPCHRVIASSGKLQGYAGGLKIKQWLLQHEQCFITSEAS